VNRFELTAHLTRTEPLRHTPAGIPVLQVGLEHQAEVEEAGSVRTVTLDMPAVAMGDLARSLAQAEIPPRIRVIGFLAPRRQGSNQLVLHIQSIVQAE
jgi:primosomal replication protein N